MCNGIDCVVDDVCTGEKYICFIVFLWGCCRYYKWITILFVYLTWTLSCFFKYLFFFKKKNIFFQTFTSTYSSIWPSTFHLPLCSIIFCLSPLLHFPFSIIDIVLLCECVLIIWKMLLLKSEVAAAGSYSGIRPRGEVKPASVGR